MKKSNQFTASNIILIIVFLAISVFSIHRIYNSRIVIGEIARVDVPLIERLTNIETHQLEQAINFERAIRYSEEIGTLAEATKGFEVADSIFRYLAELVDVELLMAEQEIRDALNKTTSKNQKLILKSLLNSMKKMEKEHTNYEDHALAVMKLLEDGRLDMAQQIVERVEGEEEKFNKKVEGVLMRLELFTEEVASSAENKEYSTLRWIVMFTCFFIMISLVGSSLSKSMVNVPISKIKEGAEKIKRGEMDARVDLQPSGLTGELASSFNEMAHKLEAAQKEIDRYTQFSYTTAHDLKAPVTNLKGLISILESTDKNDKNYANTLEHIKKSSNQLFSTVSALNEVIALRETLKAKNELVNVKQIYENIISSISQQVEQSKAKINTDFSNCPELNFPSIHLKSIMQNLLTNSIKYRNPEKPLEIDVTSKMNNKVCSIIIKDNGLGFDSEVNGKEILNPFTRLHNHVEGSGLGMYIVKSIVDYHNGELIVESKPNVGTSITINIG